jgi:hypothetical protein
MPLASVIMEYNWTTDREGIILFQSSICYENSILLTLFRHQYKYVAKCILKNNFVLESVSLHGLGLLVKAIGALESTHAHTTYLGSLTFFW